MKISIICASQQNDSQSLKISQYLQKILHISNTDTYILELAKNPLAFAETEYPGEEKIIELKTQERLEQILPELESSDGFIFVSPEWSGMATPMLKNLILHTEHEFSHKPVLLTTVSASHGGAFPIAELRMSGYKNTLYNIIPEHLIIRNVQKVLNTFEIDEQIDSREDVFLKKRTRFAVNLLLKYAKALQIVRADGLPLFELSENGMS
jgi:NAD(P)H-dependent FMN reductase